MKILVVGNRGNMGRRYQLICESLGCEVTGWDIGYGHDTGITGKRYSLDKYAGVIVAAPTTAHYQILSLYAGKLPILCEKPICANPTAVDELLALKGMHLRMINQYQYFENQREESIVKNKVHTDVYNAAKKTYYNYFKHGNDGLLWDCINIIGLAQGPCEIGEDSLTWECVINGHRCNLGDMDAAYIWNITDWISKFDCNHNYIRHAHKKVAEMKEVITNGVD